MTIPELIELLKALEAKKDIAMYIIIDSDGSCSINEFWSDKIIEPFNDLLALENYLKNETN